MRAEPKLILDFDIENRPLAYLGPDYTTAEITAIAACFVGSTKIECWELDPDDLSQSYWTMLKEFEKMYDSADIVTGHYILGHDLPVINGARLEMGLKPLGPKYVQDTKVHLTNSKYISESQESLAGMLGISSPKFHMTNQMWREANRLTMRGRTLTRTRVMADVRQHMKLRKRLLELGALGGGVWRSDE